MINENIFYMKNINFWSKANYRTTKFTYSPLGEAFEKPTKTLKDQRVKQVKALKVLKPAGMQKLKSNEYIFPEY